MVPPPFGGFVQTRQFVAQRQKALGLLDGVDVLAHDVLDDLVELLTVVPVAALEPVLVRFEEAFRDAVPSRNGSVRDAHVLALAWSVEADVWTGDRDFAGTGVATWSTPNLMRGLAEAGGG